MTVPRSYPQLVMGRKFSTITIDLEKCTVPFLCKKCLQICPEACFHVTRVMQKEERLLEIFSEIARKTQKRDYLEFRNWDVLFEYIEEMAKDRIVIVFEEVC